MNRAQAATETLILLAIGLLILGTIIYYTSDKITFVSNAKRMSEARATVEDLTRAANEVYSEGVGSRKEVFIRIPEGVDYSESFIGKPAGAAADVPSKSIRIRLFMNDNVSDTPPATTEYEVRGSFPNEAGGHWVTVVAREGYVQIGQYNIVVSPVGLSAFMRPDNITTKSFEVTNEGTQNMDVIVTENWNYSDVTISTNESAFILTPGASKTVGVTFDSSGSSLDAYSGLVEVNGTIGSDTDIIEVSLLAIVTLEQESNILTYPNGWSVSVDPGMSTSKSFSVCNNFNDSKTVDLEITGNLSLSFLASETNLTTSRTVLGGACNSFNVYLSVPTNATSGLHYGYVSTTFGGHTDQSTISMNVTPDAISPTVNIVSPLNATYPVSWVWANVSLDEEGSSCSYSLDGGANQSMSSKTTSYYYANVSGLSGSHKIIFYCSDLDSNIGKSNISFSYAVVDNAPEITITSPESTTYGHNWVWGNISVNEPASWCGIVIDGPALLGSATQMTGSSGNMHFWRLVTPLTVGNHNLTFFCNDSIDQWSQETIFYDYNYTTENLTIVSSEPIGTCFGGCAPSDLNAHDYGFECELDHDPKNTKCMIPLNISDVIGSANVTDVKVHIEEGFGEVVWGAGVPRISSSSMKIYISNSSVSDQGIIYCEESITPTLGDWAVACPTGSCSIPSGDNSSFHTFDCEDNPVSGGLDTVTEVNEMYVHIENNDVWGITSSYTEEGQSYRIDHVIVQVTHN